MSRTPPKKTSFDPPIEIAICNRVTGAQARVQVQAARGPGLAEKFAHQTEEAPQGRAVVLPPPHAPLQTREAALRAPDLRPGAGPVRQ